MTPFPFKGITWPAEKCNSLNYSKSSGIVRPCASIRQPYRVLCNMLAEVCRGSSGRHCSVDRKSFVVGEQSLVVRSLVYVYGSSDRIPSGDQQPGFSIANPLMSKCLFEDQS
jgi:hypothetical protein